ncbi:MAG TPA: pyridoxamine 5'-phosphate oxidase family protein [Actinophytocola sp.]|uniref:pyridoxamine 5'-phosphate oxidase family protein n=1 Tax=Actinophytocola sp. TaxID=1872138 RepID=UPI002E02B76D|nr:pyridoxamine 5'-phosphate oxidase family protein [Actinophytocola sp.]
MSNEADLVRDIIDANVFMTLSTADATGHPWVSPVYFATEDYVDFYWISAPDAAHSVNLAERPQLSIVIFNSQLRPNQARAQAVYLAAEAVQVTGADFDRGLQVYPGPPARGARVFAADELREPGPFRLYRARATQHWILCPRPVGDPCVPHGKAHDHRLAVTL